MSAYPVLYEAEYPERRNRLTVFFRALLVIPLAFVGFFISIAVFFAVIAAWFAVVITGRYPQGLYDFNAGALRWFARYAAYAYLETDRFPPFGLADDPGYPVRVRFAGPLPAYSRLRAGFRLVLAIPVHIAVYLVSIALGFAVVAGWFVALVLGRLPRGLHDVLDFGIAFTIKSYAYFFLLTETYPPFGNTDPTLTPVDPTPTLSAPGFAPPVGDGPAPGGLAG